MVAAAIRSMRRGRGVRRRCARSRGWAWRADANGGWICWCRGDGLRRAAAAWGGGHSLRELSLLLGLEQPTKVLFAFPLEQLADLLRVDALHLESHGDSDVEALESTETLNQKQRLVEAHPLRREARAAGRAVEAGERTPSGLRRPEGVAVVWLDARQPTRGVDRADCALLIWKIGALQLQLFHSCRGALASAWSSYISCYMARSGGVFRGASALKTPSSALLRGSVDRSSGTAHGRWLNRGTRGVAAEASIAGVAARLQEAVCSVERDVLKEGKQR